MAHAEDADLVAADLILLSIVPPADAEALARRLAPRLAAAPRKKPVYIDANAVSPETVGRIAGDVAPTGAPFLDGAILGPAAEARRRGPRDLRRGRRPAPALALRDLRARHARLPGRRRRGVQPEDGLCRHQQGPEGARRPHDPGRRARRRR